MKVEWEPKDIRLGRVVGKPGRGERWIIGYSVARSHRFALVSLSDGMIQNDADAAEMASFLNKAGELPVELLGE